MFLSKYPPCRTVDLITPNFQLQYLSIFIWCSRSFWQEATVQQTDCLGTHGWSHLIGTDRSLLGYWCLGKPCGLEQFAVLDKPCRTDMKAAMIIISKQSHRQQKNAAKQRSSSENKVQPWDKQWQKILEEHQITTCRMVFLQDKSQNPQIPNVLKESAQNISMLKSWMQLSRS